MSGSPSHHDYDVVVVGARVAGSLSSILLARSGLDVLLLDRARFPSFTSSTHFFRGNGMIRVLALAAALDDVLALGSPPLHCEYSYAGGSSQAERGPAQDPGAAGFDLSVRRETLDAVLVEVASREGVEVRTQTAVANVALHDGRAVGVELADGTVEHADLVVGADGRRSIVAAAVAARDRERHPGKRALYYRYVTAMAGPETSQPDGAEFSLLGDQLAYVFPSDQDLTCVAISVNLATYDELRHRASEGFDALLRHHTGLWDRYVAAVPHQRILGAGPEDDFVRQAAGPGWALVGDAGIHQDPWTGVGMDTAAVSADVLVRTAVAGGIGASDVWAQKYEDERDAAVIDWFHETVQGAADLSVLAG